MNGWLIASFVSSFVSHASLFSNLNCASVSFVSVTRRRENLNEKVLSNTIFTVVDPVFIKCLIGEVAYKQDDV